MDYDFSPGWHEVPPQGGDPGASGAPSPPWAKSPRWRLPSCPPAPASPNPWIAWRRPRFHSFPRSRLGSSGKQRRPARQWLEVCHNRRLQLCGPPKGLFGQSLSCKKDSSPHLRLKDWPQVPSLLAHHYKNDQHSIQHISWNSTQPIKTTCTHVPRHPFHIYRSNKSCHHLLTGTTTRPPLKLDPQLSDHRIQKPSSSCMSVLCAQKFWEDNAASLPGQWVTVWGVAALVPAIKQEYSVPK